MSFLDRWFPKRKPTTENPEESGEIAGERAASVIARVPSLQSRVSNLLAIGLMSLLGVGFLGWYYARALSKSSEARDTAQSATQKKLQGDAALPPLGRIDVPADSTVGGLLGPPPEEPPPEDVPDAWLRPAVDTPPTFPSAGSAAKSPQQLVLERKLSGPVVAAQLVEHTPAEGMPAVETEGQDAREGVAALLKPSILPAVRASVLPTERLLLGKGAFIDCTLETAIDSTLPGLVTCITATDTFGADGTVVLLERGTKLIGETRGQIQQGAARIFVLWTEARTPPPNSVVIPLASPGTDDLGRSGLSGQINRHFFERFGAAILMSVIDGAIQREVQSKSDGGTVIYDPSTSQDIATEVLKSTVNIPPTLIKHNGDRIKVLVARDLDFRSVYELRPATHE